jgi:CheY-like chemotaxis protein
LTDRVATDNRINQTILATFLMKRGIKYDVANNGVEAVEKWKTGNFHLVLVRFVSLVLYHGLWGTDVRLPW